MMLPLPCCVGVLYAPSAFDYCGRVVLAETVKRERLNQYAPAGNAALQPECA